MKQSEFLRWLIKHGVKVENGTRHLKLYYQENVSHLSRHPSQELKTGTVEGLKSN